MSFARMMLEKITFIPLRRTQKKVKGILFIQSEFKISIMMLVEYVKKGKNVSEMR